MVKILYVFFFFVCSYIAISNCTYADFIGSKSSVAKVKVNELPKANFNPCNNKNSLFSIREAKLLSSKVVIIDCEKDEDLHVFKNVRNEENLAQEGFLSYVELPKLSYEKLFIEEKNVYETEKNTVEISRGVARTYATFYYTDSPKCEPGQKLLNYALAEDFLYLEFHAPVVTDICISVEPKNEFSNAPFLANVVAVKNVDSAKEMNAVDEVRSNYYAIVAISGVDELVGVTINVDKSYQKTFRLTANALFPNLRCKDLTGVILSNTSTNIILFNSYFLIRTYDYVNDKSLTVFDVSEGRAGFCSDRPNFDFAKNNGIDVYRKSFLWKYYNQTKQAYELVEIEY